MKLFRPAIKISAFVMLLWGSVMLLPILVSLGNWQESQDYLWSALTCYAFAGLLFRLSAGPLQHMQPRALFMITALNWLLLCLTGTLPFLYSSLDISFTDALFETVSGVTTTGSSIFADYSNIPRGILLWRSLMQFVGGIGVIIVAVAILPSLKVGGMRLFRSESSEWSQLESGRIGKIATNIMYVYVLINVACVLAYRWFGMSWFDAVNHALTTVSTGGLSTYPDSFAHFSNSHLELVASIFMVLGACPFLLIVLSVINRNPLLLFKDTQVRLLLGLILLNTFLVALWRYASTPDANFLNLLESTTFNIISIMTTTGFASEDYTLWGSFPLVVFFYLMFTGGCSGSTTGGVKLFRFQLLGIFMREHLHSALHPGIAYSRRYNDRPIHEDILVSALAYFFFVIITWSICASLLAAFGLDFVTSTTGAVSALMNVGPGFGDVIGPVDNYGSLPDPAKYVLAAAMLLGRLEYLALVIIFTPEFWKW
jgi:trk system potassium uptake protein TrkH